MNSPPIFMQEPAIVLGDLTLVEMMLAAGALLAIVAVLWKIARWFDRQGHSIPPIRAIDIHIKRIEQEAADRSPEPETDSPPRKKLLDDR
ncbi:MAG: hypothetical protein K2X25_01635 [Caulobacteraceae bacterium]|nr:hypothetical protein [Caulobacteraceae bacterium]